MDQNNFFLIISGIIAGGEYYKEGYFPKIFKSSISFSKDQYYFVFISKAFYFAPLYLLSSSIANTFNSARFSLLIAFHVIPAVL